MIIAGVITIGTAFADTFTSVIVNGSLEVNNGEFKFERTDNIQTAMQLINSDKQTTFTFKDPDDNQRYLLKNTPGPNGRFNFVDFSGVSPTNRVDLSIQRATGNIGIGTIDPTELLDVNGNLRVRGNIVSTGDICIGNCP